MTHATKTGDAVRSFSVGDAQVAILRNEEAVAHEACARLVEVLRRALESRGTAHLVLTGGSSAVSLHRALATAPWNVAIDWHYVHFWWGDERFVPRDHPESNAGLAYRTLFNFSAFAGEDGGTGGTGGDIEARAEPGLVIDTDKVHPIQAEEAIARTQGPEWAAQAYASEIERFVERADGAEPTFDVILTGVGPDGHTLSAFPGGPALGPDAPLVLAVGAPEHVEPHLARVTLSTRVFAAASSVIVMSAGTAKADVISNVLGSERDPARWPAQAAILSNATWLIDEAAGSKLQL